MKIILEVVDAAPGYSKFLRTAAQYDVETKVLSSEGPGGWPEIQFTGTRSNLVRFFVKTQFFGGDLQETREMIDEYGE